MRLLAAGVAAAVLVIAAGCGSGGGGGGGAKGESGADFVPADAPGFVYLNTDFEGSQWQNLETLSEKFPQREQLLAMIRTQLSDAGITWDEVKAALGPETDVGILTFKGETGNVVGLNEPKDKDELDALIEKADQASGGDETVKGEIDGWVAVSDTQAAIDAAKRAHDGDSLADDDRFKDATGELSDDALFNLYLNGAKLQQQASSALQGAGGTLTGGGKLDWISGDVTAEEGGLGLHFFARTTGGEQPKTYTSELVDEVPAGTLLYFSFNNLGSGLNQVAKNPQLQQQLGAIQGLLGISFTQLTDLLNGEGAFYVRQGSPFPELTLVLKEDNPQLGVQLLDRVVARAGAFVGQQLTPQRTVIAGVPAKKVSFGSYAVYYAGFDGKLVVTSASTGISGLKESGDKLADDSVFKAAVDAAGMPDETVGFLYANLKDSVPVIENFAQTAGEPLPSDVSANLAPLQSFLLYGSSDGDTTKVAGFLSIE